MARDDRKRLLRDGDALLVQWGLRADADVAACAKLIGRAPAADAALVRRLGGIESEESARLLRELEESSPHRDVAREVRRALYRLRQSGISVPDPKPEEAPRPIFASAVEGYASAIDGGGDRIVWLLRRRPGAFVHLAAVINDPAGLIDVRVDMVTRKALSRLRSNMEKTHGLRLIDCGGEYADFLVHRAFLWAREHGRQMHGDYPAARRQISGDPPPQTMPPLIERYVAIDEVRDDAALLASSESLLDEMELRAWLLDRDTAQGHLDEVDRIRDGPILLDEKQQQERIEACVARAVCDRFGGEMRESQVRRLQEMAAFLFLTRRADAGRRALAVALALAEPEQDGTGIPFCEAVVRGSLAAWGQERAQHEQEQAESSLLVTPAQFREEQRRRR